jgi:hypothetical protein
VSGDERADPRAETAQPASTSADPDVRAIVADVREEVRRSREAGEYPAALLDRLRTELRMDAGGEPPEVLARIESARPLRSQVPGIGPVIVFSRRVLRRLLAWYVAPIARDQTRFNEAILHELRELGQRVARLEEAGHPPRGGRAAKAPRASATPGSRDEAAGRTPDR